MVISRPLGYIGRPIAVTNQELWLNLRSLSAISKTIADLEPVLRLEKEVWGLMTPMEPR